MKKKSIKKKFQSVEEMDRFLEDQDLSQTFATKGRVVSAPLKKINLDLPLEVVDQIDKIADQIGISRQPLLKIWIHEKIKEVSQ